MIILYILSFGIVYVICYYFPKIKIKLFYIKKQATESQYVEIRDFSNKTYILVLEYINFNKKNSKIYCVDNASKSELNIDYDKCSIYLNNQEIFKPNIICFSFKYNKYMYSDTLKTFLPIKFELSNYLNQELHTKFGEGIKNVSDYNFLLNKFGYNDTILKEKSFVTIFIEQLLKKIYLYQIVSVFIWFYQSYYSMSIIVIILSLFIILVNTYYNFRNYKKLLTVDDNKNITIIRKIKNLSGVEVLDHLKIGRFIVPGDIIELTNGCMVPCDCLLLDGYCTVNESDLTGESSHVLKTSLPSNSNKFDYKNKKHFLYYGTKIVKCNSNKYSKKIRLLCINTGFNTNRGNQFQNILFSSNKHNKFTKEIYLFITSIFLFYLISCILYVLIYNNLNKQNVYSDKILSIEDFYVITAEPVDISNIPHPIFNIIILLINNLTILVPPTLPLCITFATFYFNYRLEKDNIDCINENKLIDANFVNTIIIDKTGTLTEELVELYGYQVSKIHKSNDNVNLDNNDKNNKQYNKKQFAVLDGIETESKVYNLVHTEFWKRYIKNTNNVLFENMHSNLNNNIIFFYECLACCHSIDKLGNEYFGNSIDKRIFEDVGWIQILNEDINKYELYPKNSYKITEDILFMNTNNNIYSKKYKQTILKRFEFSSKFQSMSIIAKNSIDNSCRFFIKGAPEKVLLNCKKETIPEDYQEELLNHTKKGLRVLACATKLISKKDYLILDSLNREFFEDNLIFLGFIVFKNKLKKDTKNIVEIIKNSGNRLVMATGDNPFTSISVAQECSLIPLTNMSLFLLDIEKSSYYNKLKIEKFYEQDTEKVKDFNNKNSINKKDNNNKNKLKVRNSILGYNSLQSKLELEVVFPLTNNGLNNISNNRKSHKHEIEQKNIKVADNSCTSRLDKSNEIKSNYIINKTFTMDNQNESNINFNKNNLIESSIKINTIKDFLKAVNNLIEEPSKNNIICVSGNIFKYVVDNNKEYVIQKSKYKKELRKSRLSIINVIRNSILYRKTFTKDNYESLKIIKDSNKQILHVDNPLFVKYHNTIISKLLTLMDKKGIIFYRMSPTNKVELVNLLKSNKHNIVAMCGDGSNDCGALLNSDVGISLTNSFNQSNITSHFFSKDDSIKCIDIILRHGKACYENNVIVFKYMLHYSIIQLTSKLILYTKKRDFVNNQYLFIDFFVSLMSCLLISKTGASYNLSNINNKLRLFDFKFISTSITHIIVIISSQIIYFYYIIINRIDFLNDPSIKLKSELDQVNSVSKY